MEEGAAGLLEASCAGVNKLNFRQAAQECDHVVAAYSDIVPKIEEAIRGLSPQARPTIHTPSDETWPLNEESMKSLLYVILGPDWRSKAKKP